MCLNIHKQSSFRERFSREVSCRYVIARYPLTLDVRDVLKSAATFGPVESHQIFQQSGQVMVKYQAMDSAVTAYGATVPGPIYFSVGNSSKDLVMSFTHRMERVKLITFHQPALTDTNLKVATNPLPEFRVPDLASASPPATVPSTRHPHLPLYMPDEHVPTDHASTPWLHQIVRFTPSAPDSPQTISPSRPSLTHFLHFHHIQPKPPAHTGNTLHALLHSDSYSMQIHQHITTICAGKHLLLQLLNVATLTSMHAILLLSVIAKTLPPARSDLLSLDSHYWPCPSSTSQRYSTPDAKRSLSRIRLPHDVTLRAYASSSTTLPLQHCHLSRYTPTADFPHS